MTHTTIDIEDLKRVKREAMERDMTLKELVNQAIKEYLKKPHQKGGDTMPRKKVTPEVIEEMRRLRGEGLTYAKIAERLGLSMMTVYGHLRRKPGIIGRLRRRMGLG